MERYLYKDLRNLEETHWWHIAKRKTCLNLIRKFFDVRNPLILDVGCGTGKNIDFFKSLGEVWGIDSSLEAVKLCKKRGLVRVRQASAEKIPFPDNFFNLVTLLDVLEHTDDKKTIEEIRRILKPGGLVILSVPAYGWMWSHWDEVLHHKRRYNINSLNKILRQGRFRILKLSYLYSFLVLPAFIIRWLKSKMFRKRYASDFGLNFSILNWLLGKVADIESRFMLNVDIPFGLTLIAVASKS